MANVKITELTALTTPAGTDVLPIVDVVSDVTKKITVSDLNAAVGGYADPLTTDGDIVIRSGGVTTRLGIGSTDQVLKVAGGLPVWAAEAASDVVLDTSPQLGGNLDVNGNYIVSASGGNVEIAPDTTGSFVIRGNNTDGSITLNCTANTHGVTIQSPPHASAATYTLILPNDTGTSGQVLSTNGTGTLSWLTATEPGDNISTLTNDSGFITSTVTGDFTVDTNTLYVDSANNRVGIGTTNPTETLTIDGNIEFESNTQSIKFAAGNSATNSIEVNSGSGPRASIDFLGVGTNQVTDIVFKTSETSSTSAERMRIDSSGNLGLGTTSPNQKLEVSATNPRIRITDDNTTAASSTSYLEFQGSDARSSVIFTDSSGFNIQADAAGANALRFLTNGSNERMRIDSSGNLGIGTITPGEKLEVNGTIKATDINFTGLATYADDTAAGTGGLVAGDVYKTSTGELRIKL